MELGPAGPHHADKRNARIPARRSFVGGRAAPGIDRLPDPALHAPDLPLTGKTLIAARWRPFGFNNHLWQGRLDTGRWERLPDSVTGGDPHRSGGTGSGISIAVRSHDLRDANLRVSARSNAGGTIPAAGDRASLVHRRPVHFE